MLTDIFRHRLYGRHGISAFVFEASCKRMQARIIEREPGDFLSFWRVLEASK